jgi:hypothetical protein
MYTQFISKLTGAVMPDHIVRDADGKILLADPLDPDWQAYEAWLAAGNQPSAAPPWTPPPPTLSYLQFEALFTQGESTAIFSAAQGNAALFRWLLRAAGAQAIDLGNAEVRTGLDALVAAGLVTADREAAILAGRAPPAG